MNDGTICVHFNDSSSLALAPGKKHFDYIHPSAEQLNGYRENHRVDATPDELQNKVYLTQHFQSYILARLTGEYEFLYNNVELKTGMVYISKYLRMKHVIVFRLSNDVIQVSAERLRIWQWLTAVQLLRPYKAHLVAKGLGHLDDRQEIRLAHLVA